MPSQEGDDDMSLRFFLAGVAAEYARKREEMAGTHGEDKLDTRSVEESIVKVDRHAIAYASSRHPATLCSGLVS